MLGRMIFQAASIALFGLAAGCQEGSSDDAISSNQVRERVVAAMDCDEQLMHIRALSESRPAEETYRQLDELVAGGCSAHQGILAERFIVGSSYRIGASPDELVRGIDWQSSANRQLLWAISLAGIKKNLSSPAPEDVLEHFMRLAPSDFLPRILLARLYQQRDDIAGVDRELQEATRLLGGEKSEIFQIERSQLAPIYFLEGRKTEAYEMSMDFVKLYADEAWNSPDMIGIAAMSAIDVGRPDEAQALIEEVLRRNPDARQDDAVKTALAELELKHPEYCAGVCQPE